MISSEKKATLGVAKRVRGDAGADKRRRARSLEVPIVGSTLVPSVGRRTLPAAVQRLVYAGLELGDLGALLTATGEARDSTLTYLATLPRLALSGPLDARTRLAAVAAMRCCVQLRSLLVDPVLPPSHGADEEEEKEVPAFCGAVEKLILRCQATLEEVRPDVGDRPPVDYTTPTSDLVSPLWTSSPGCWQALAQCPRLRRWAPPSLLWGDWAALSRSRPPLETIVAGRQGPPLTTMEQFQAEVYSACVGAQGNQGNARLELATTAAVEAWSSLWRADAAHQIEALVDDLCVGKWPALRALRIDRDVPAPLLVRLLGACQTLTSVELTLCTRFHTPVLRALLQSCPQLVKLGLHDSTEAASEQDWPGPSATTLITAAALEELFLDAADDASLAKLVFPRLRRFKGGSSVILAKLVDLLARMSALRSCALRGPVRAGPRPTSTSGSTLSSESATAASKEAAQVLALELSGSWLSLLEPRSLLQALDSWGVHVTCSLPRCRESTTLGPLAATPLRGLERLEFFAKEGLVACETVAVLLNPTHFPSLIELRLRTASLAPETLDALRAEHSERFHVLRLVDR